MEIESAHDSMRDGLFRADAPESIRELHELTPSSLSVSWTRGVQ